MNDEELKQLQIPPTQLEVAELLTAAATLDHQLTKAGIIVLRRLIFDWNRVTEELNRLEIIMDDMEQLSQDRDLLT